MQQARLCADGRCAMSEECQWTEPRVRRAPQRDALPCNSRSGRLSEAEQTAAADVFAGGSREGTGHALYKTDQALLFNAPRRSDFYNFGVTGRAGVARGLWARPATSRHRRLYASADRLRDSARGKPFSRDLSGVEARRPHVHSCGRRAARRGHPMAKRRAGLLRVWQAADRSPRS